MTIHKKHDCEQDNDRDDHDDQFENRETLASMRESMDHIYSNCTTVRIAVILLTLFGILMIRESYEVMPIISHQTLGHRVYLATGLIALGVCLGAPVAHAMNTISQGYAASSDMAVGSLVSLADNSTDTVVLASSKNVSNLFGVVVNDGSSVLTLENGTTSQVQIATGGVLPTLVSDCNGSIAAGDPITASPIEGVGMVATTNIKIVGIAQGKMTGAKKQTVDKGICSSGEVTLGQVGVLVGVSYHYREPEKTIIPATLQNIANAIAGKSVNSLPIIISAGIFLITVIIVVAIIYSMIRSSIISVGRNPMAQSAVYRDVIQLSALVLAILGVAIIAIYLVLTRM